MCGGRFSFHPFTTRCRSAIFGQNAASRRLRLAPQLSRPPVFAQPQERGMFPHVSLLKKSPGTTTGGRRSPERLRLHSSVWLPTPVGRV